MRAGELFKYAHMAVFATSVSLGIAAFSPAYAQEVEEVPDVELPSEEDDGETPVEEENEPPLEQEDEGEEEEYPEEYPEEEIAREGDNPSVDRVARKRLLLVKSDREAYGIPILRRINPPTTSAVEEAITDSYRFCSRLEDQRYLADCTGERLLSVARNMPSTGEYAEARVILVEAAKKVRALAAANKAPAAPRVRATGKVGKAVVRTRPLTPVRKESVKQVNRQAAAILQEAETKLLRAAQSSDRRLIAYAQIAKAVGSNKKLLRSA